MKTGKPFLTAEWLYLAMLNYEIQPEVLHPRLPAGTELDFFEGRTFVSIVGFLFMNTRVLGWRIPGHHDFEEINLRFYVCRNLPDGPRRGVVFIKEIVPKRAIAVAARALYNENYIAAPTRHEIQEDSRSIRAEYAWYSGERRHSLMLECAGAPQSTEAGTPEQFLIEHYWGYTCQRNGSTVEYPVTHAPWRIWPARSAVLDCDAATLYGAEFADVLSGPAASAFLADGSHVTVGRAQRIA